MANWQTTLDIKDAFQKASNDEISCQELSKIIAEKLKCLKLTKAIRDNELVMEERQELIEEFEGLAEQERLTKNGFDNVFASLYDWADAPLSFDDWPRKKVCWIKTF